VPDNGNSRDAFPSRAIVWRGAQIETVEWLGLAL